VGIFYYSLVCIGAVGSDARDATCDSPLTLSARKQGAMETTAHRKSRRKVEKRKHNPDRLPQERSERNYMDFIRQRNLSKDQPKKFHSKRNKTFGARSGARGGRRRGKEIQRFKRGLGLGNPLDGYGEFRRRSGHGDAFYAIRADTVAQG
jgi:hypothetical protein